MAFFAVILDSKYSKMTPKFVKQKSHWLHSSIKFANPDCTAPGCVLNVLAGLLPASRWWPDILPGQRNFSFVVLFLTGQNIGKKVNLSFCNFYFVNTIVFFQRKDLRERIWLFFHERECMHDQSMWPATEVFGQASCSAGQILSFDRRLFWAVHLIWGMSCDGSINKVCLIWPYILMYWHKTKQQHEEKKEEKMLLQMQSSYNN